jgi:hypothetical protein
MQGGDEHGSERTLECVSDRAEEPTPQSERATPATKNGPEAPAQSAPPVGGREDGTLEGPVRLVRYEPRVQPREAIRLRKRYSAE